KRADGSEQAGSIRPDDERCHRGAGHRGWEAFASREAHRGDIQSRGWKWTCLFEEHHGMTPGPLGSLLNGFVSTEWSACLEATPADSGTHVYAIIVTVQNGQFPLYVGQTG